MHTYETLCAARALADGETAARLRRARELLDRRCSDPIDLAAAARHACLSPYHFLREFRRAFGETPHRYLTRRRIELAKELLETTSMSVTEVCLTVGFQSLGSFSGLFQRYTGHSPSRYRARQFRLGGLAGTDAELTVPLCFASRFLPPRLPAGARAPCARDDR